MAPLFALGALLLAIPGGAATRPADDPARLEKVVARVGDTEITVGDIEERLKRHMRPGMFEDREKLEQLVEAMVDRELLVQEARRRKLHENKRVVDHLKRILYNQMQTKYVSEQMPLDSITDEEIRAYYEEHRDEYNQPTLVRAYHVMLSDEQEAREVLEQVKREEMDLRQFKVLAGEKSEDPATKKRGGDLRYFTAGGKVWTSEETVPEEVAEAAFSVEILVRAHLIVTDEQEQAKEALNEAMMPGLTDAQYRKLAAKYTKADVEGAIAGRTPLFNLEGELEGTDEKLPRDLTRAAFSLREPSTTYPKVIPVDGLYYVLRVVERQDPGNLYPEVITSSRGHHVLWVVNRRPSVHKSVEEMEPSIRQRIWQKKKKEFIDELIEKLERKHEVKVYEERLEKVEIDLSAQAGARFSPGKAPSPPGSHGSK
jgi:peptidyl-prolyl cis-trans isomerase C